MPQLVGAFWPVYFLNPFYVRQAHAAGQITCPLDPTPNGRLWYYRWLGCDAVLANDPAATIRALGAPKGMKLAVNYSTATAGLLAGGEVAFDYFKCPAWPDLIATAEALRPVNVHFPLLVGAGHGDAVDGETGELPDWGRFEAILAARAPR